MNLFKRQVEIPRILITGGSGFIGGALIRKILQETECLIFNLDKMSYASSLESINNTLKNIGDDNYTRHNLLKVDLSNSSKTEDAIAFSNPDLVFHLAAESHVDRSISGPEIFINSNIVGTFNLLESVRKHYNNLSSKRKETFRFLHISTDEVFGSLNEKGYFNEFSQYDPRSPYSASKSSSDHLVNAWHHTFGLPTITTNCSNNYGPWQYPEKLIPKIIMNAINNKKIPIYGDGENIRDWLFVSDHVDGLIKVINDGNIGEKYCIGGNEEKSNNQLVNIVCELLDKIRPQESSFKNLITYVEDRLGHDKRYAIDSSKIKSKLGWEPSYSFDEGIKITIEWYLKNLNFMKNL
tara:strand:+ start:10195 stop:11250 length:1056 start_codon:yes stop_codon:yes gene_type:complete